MTPRFHPIALGVLALCGPTFAQSTDTTPKEKEAPAQVAAVHLEPVEITGRHYDNAVGTSDAASQGVIRAELMKSRPALRPGEVLEFVPGVIVTQHSGDGKANQYFLRGFNLDHGTDFATSINGIPVNMPSHGHGQGYTDLNFLIPELVDRIEYRKGPYFAKSGDFSSAGSADIAYRTTFDAPFASLGWGQRGYRRGLVGGSGKLGGDNTVLAALELQHNDGPWTVPEDLKRANGVLTFGGGSKNKGWSTSLMAYDASWTATDQIPERLITEGYNGQPFSRFDTLDPTSGGKTRRTSLSTEWRDIGDDRATRLSAYAIDYRLSLFSNFTYALDSADDQFSQQDKRTVYGFAANHSIDHVLGSLPARSEVGVQLRHDRARVGLFESSARVLGAAVRDDKVRETMLGIYGQTSLELNPWLRSVVGLRADSVRFTVDNQVTPGSATDGDQQLSPKFSLIAGPWAKTEFFFNAGRGFHSNDARGATDPARQAPGLAASRGYEVGARTEWIPGLQSSVALWKLDFDSELLYVGDAGTTEDSLLPSKRRGVEWNNRWTPNNWLLFDADLAWSHARFRHAGMADRIPNAVDKVASVAVSLKDLAGWSASLQWRYLGSGALVENNSVRSYSSATTNLRVSRKLWKDAELTLDVFNLFDRDVYDIQYYYESQPAGLPAREDRHVHPAEPRTVRLTLKIGF
ncbi:TonB-dependent receptor [Piscinibacter gummiphilus]|uniref:TonB-dependent receptor n=1 Tax=Piscinibacter gummiphilus TaxID=946333 RepID=A0ABZ0CQE6_9BURK|nr:TonB-dependent receptor [Piscinibacter gummiphilus]WOB07203.1 TonB-dependent receptor [Piscinibacter gummiphilus]